MHPNVSFAVMPEPVSVTVHIDAPADRVYELVSDLPRMGEWSPENVGGHWMGGATGPAPGIKFRGKNRNGNRRWTTLCTVIEARPGEAFVFDVYSGPMAVARWSYRIAPSNGGCDVTESWNDKRWRPFASLSSVVTGVKDRPAFTRTSIETTLANLKAAAEA